MMMQVHVHPPSSSLNHQVTPIISPLPLILPHSETVSPGLLPAFRPLPAACSESGDRWACYTQQEERQQFCQGVRMQQWLMSMAFSGVVRCVGGAAGKGGC